jgi:hypothetical protein
MVERVETVDDDERTTLRGYRISPFQKQDKEGTVMISPLEITSVMAVIKADQEEERRDFLLRVELKAVKERHRR